MKRSTEIGARWLRCDLHVHTPFDPTKGFGVDLEAAKKANEKGDSSKKSFFTQRDHWFARTRLREDDWELLCDYVFGGDPPDPPAKLAALVECLKVDRALLEEKPGLALEQTRTYQLIKDFGDGQNLTGHFLNVIKNIRPETLNEMEIFLPEDLIRSELRDTTGSFRSIEQGSVGQKSTAILSLCCRLAMNHLLLINPKMIWITSISMILSSTCFANGNLNGS